VRSTKAGGEFSLETCVSAKVETHENLVKEVLDELLLERSTCQETVEIGTEEFCDEVDIFER